MRDYFFSRVISQRIKHLEEAVRTMKGDLVKRHDEDRAECDRQMGMTHQRIDAAHLEIDAVEKGLAQHGERLSAIEAVVR